MPGSGVRRRLLLALFCVVLTVAGAVIAGRLGGPTRGGAAERSGSPASTAAAPTASPLRAGSQTGQPPHSWAPVEALLDTRARAVLESDRSAWSAGLDPSADPAVRRFRAAQQQLFDRVTGNLRPYEWSYQVRGGSALPEQRLAALGDQAWLADVQLSYRLREGSPLVRRQQHLTVVHRSGTWLLAADTDGATGRDVWDLGPVGLEESGRCLVVGSRRRLALIEELARECVPASATVDAAWGEGWPRRSVVTVPDTVTHLAVLLGRAPDADATAASDASAGLEAGLERTAAVTIGPADGAADEVLINASAFDGLNDLGRRVVLTHELVHVATRATGARHAPTWLTEGYADHVAYADTGLSPEQIAGEALAAVRAGRTPTRLPAADDFNAAGDQAAVAYGGAWAAVDAITAMAGGSAGMKDFYRRAAGTEGLEPALEAAGLAGEPALVAVWQAHLIDLAG